MFLLLEEGYLFDCLLQYFVVDPVALVINVRRYLDVSERVCLHVFYLYESVYVTDLLKIITRIFSLMF